MIELPLLRQLVGSAPTDDDALALERDSVIATLERETGRLLARRVGHVSTFTRVADTQRTVWLELYPIESVTKVEESDDGDSWEEATEPWQVVSVYGLRKPTWTVRPFVRVTYTGGFAAAPSSPSQVKTPADLAKAIALQVQFERARNGPNLLAVQSQAFEGGSGVMLDPFMHPTFKAAVKAYKRYS